MQVLANMMVVIIMQYISVLFLSQLYIKKAGEVKCAVFLFSHKTASVGKNQLKNVRSDLGRITHVSQDLAHVWGGWAGMQSIL